jgi:hypothetical protein
VYKRKASIKNNNNNNEFTFDQFYFAAYLAIIITTIIPEGVISWKYHNQIKEYSSLHPKVVIDRSCGIIRQLTQQ